MEALALNVVASGLLAVGYAMMSMPLRPAGLVAMLVVHAAYVVFVPRLFPILPATPPSRSRPSPTG